jgi:polysaccharide deacetylase 2 family uncharacterized protein YibQ
VKRRKKKASYPYRSILLISLSLTAIVVLSIFIMTRPRRRPVSRLKRGPRVVMLAPRVSRAETAERLRRRIEESGREDIWIRRAAHPDVPSPDSAVSWEIIATPHVYDKVLSAIEQGAREEHLAVRERRVAMLPEGHRRTEITLSSGREIIGEWRLREAPQIARVAVVIDDLGQNLAAARALLRIHAPLTFSIMPHLPYSEETAREAHQQGIEVMLHLPMQPLADSAPDVSAREIKVGMGQGEVARIFENDLASVPYAAGVNNHMGSRATSDRRLMEEVMNQLARRRLFFIDSRTTADSVALDVAREDRVPAFYRSVFLDDTQNVPYTLHQFHELVRVAQKNSVALAIGHPYPTTIAALAQALPELERENIQLVRASELVHLPEVAHLMPPRPRPLL